MDEKVTLIENVINVVSADQIKPNPIQTLDNEEIVKKILDFSHSVDYLINLLEELYKRIGNDAVEVITTLSRMYTFGGTKMLENTLLSICKKDTQLSSFLKLECAKALLSFEEPLENETDKNDDDFLREIKRLSNADIRIRNEKKQHNGFSALDLCLKYLDDSTPTPYRVESIFLLMTGLKWSVNCTSHLISVLNDNKIDCDYRYKIILRLEKNSKIPVDDNYFYRKQGCISFLNNERNMTLYRILAAQYLLQVLKVENEEFNNAIQKLLSFAEDVDLDYNLRADAADTLLSLGDDKARARGREIINLLGRIFQKSIHENVFTNAQNVHVSEIEQSVSEILEFLISIKTDMDGESVCFEIVKLLNENRCATAATTTTEACLYCSHEIKLNETLVSEFSADDFCSPICKEAYEKISKIIISINRIRMDRAVYTKYNQSLINILLKVWEYSQSHPENKEELTKRVLEELTDMSGTCSSGFASRLANVISGFGDFNMRISFEDQIVANFAGRLSALVRKIMEPNSIYFTTKHRDVVEITLRAAGIISKRREASELENKETLKQFLDCYLKRDARGKIAKAVKSFYENVVVEMANETYEEKPHFSYFFRQHMLQIREELYEEFKGYMTDTEFDLASRKAISVYEGLQKFV